MRFILHWKTYGMWSRDKELSNVYLNSLYVAFYTAVFGQRCLYMEALWLQQEAR